LGKQVTFSSSAAAAASGAGNVATTPGTSNTPTRMPSIQRKPQSPDRDVAPNPTPLFEAIYTLVSRAVQQGMRIAAEGSRLAQGKEGAMQLSLRVEEELGCLFRSKEFGSGCSGRGLRKGGAKVDGLGGGTEVESAQLTARAEAELGRLLKQVSQSKQYCVQMLDQLESRIPKHSQEEARQAADQADKPGIPGTGADGKEALTAAGDHAATAASVDALIASFRSRASPRQRPAHQSIAMQHVVAARSPLMTSLLPSPRDWARAMQQQSAEREADLKKSHVRSCAEEPSRQPPSLAIPSALKHTWAFTLDRTIHRPAAGPPSAPPPRFMSVMNDTRPSKGLPLSPVKYM